MSRLAAPKAPQARPASNPKQTETKPNIKQAETKPAPISKQTETKTVAKKTESGIQKPPANPKSNEQGR